MSIIFQTTSFSKERYSQTITYLSTIYINIFLCNFFITNAVFSNGLSGRAQGRAQGPPLQGFMILAQNRVCNNEARVARQSLFL